MKFKPLVWQPLCSALLCALVFAGTPGVSNAQGYPTKAIKFVAGYPPGGSTDSAARIVGQKLSERLGQPVVVENKPGADSSIATEYVAKAAADGYTLLLGGSGQMVFNPGLYAHLPTIRSRISFRSRCSSRARWCSRSILRTPRNRSTT